jgi:predicted TIM-barrel fold metal-dependent hydrolase
MDASLPYWIVDAWCAAGPYRTRQPGTPYAFDELLAEHERFDIGRRLCLSAEARDGVPDEGNAEITRLTAGRDDTGAIWVALPPARFGGRPAERLLADAQAAGVAMLAFFPATHGHHLATWANGDLYAAMEEARLPLAIDVAQAAGGDPGAATPQVRYEAIHAVAAAYPKLPIVLWNAWYMDERLQVPILDACPNVRVGLATVFVPTFGIEQYTARYGPDRLIFGSSWPVQSPGPLLTYVLYADVEDAAKAAILGGTVRELCAEVRWPVRGMWGEGE